MEDMKLFRVITILSSLLFLNQCIPQSQSIVTIDKFKNNFPNPLMLTENELRNPGQYSWNNKQYFNFFLQDEEKKLHQSAVYNSLNNVRDNEITKWHSKNNNTFGIVKIIHSFEVSTGYCRVYQTVIQLENQARQLTNKACKRGSSNWVFLK